ncbi:flagellar motor protein MotB [Neobacillus jeddahensis]|uniref:flagellar motor protein MotB n=1 Tax=Neobacillus jeddahensis TaxID=1461580 RepID=UPI000590C795|nr:flagellar motor protein MotB [Neobacillus jeddahensis]
MRKRRRDFDEEHEEHIDESWLIPYADILTLLLALFIVLFAASSVNKSKYDAIMESFKKELTGTNIANHQSGLSPTPPQGKTEEEPAANAKQEETKTEDETKDEDPELDQLKQKLEAYIGENKLEAMVTLSETKRGVEISFKDVILFDPGKAELKESSFDTLNILTGIMSTVPNPISIEGHTDNVPIKNSKFPSNWELSSARAVSVLHYFASKNITQDRLQFVGYGEFKPLYPNDTAAHKQANRRVNIVVLRTS